MPGPLEYVCSCGEVAIEVSAGHGFRGVCYCKHCQAFLRQLGAADSLDAAGGTEMYQTTPDLVCVTRGHDKFAALRLTKQGPLRWFTSCCQSPIANTATTSQIPFVSILLARVSDPDAAGRVRARVNTEGATAAVPGRAGGMASMVVGILTRGLTARIAGMHRETPFFRSDGAPVAEPELLTAIDKAKIY